MLATMLQWFYLALVYALALIGLACVAFILLCAWDTWMHHKAIKAGLYSGD